MDQRNSSKKIILKGNRSDILQLAGRLMNRSSPSAPSFCFNSNFTGLMSSLANIRFLFFFWNDTTPDIAMLSADTEGLLEVQRQQVCCSEDGVNVLWERGLWLPVAQNKTYLLVVAPSNTLPHHYHHSFQFVLLLISTLFEHQSSLWLNSTWGGDIWIDNKTYQSQTCLYHLRKSMKWLLCTASTVPKCVSKIWLVGLGVIRVGLGLI